MTAGLTPDGAGGLSMGLAPGFGGFTGSPAGGGTVAYARPARTAAGPLAAVSAIRFALARVRVREAVVVSIVGML